MYNRIISEIMDLTLIFERQIEELYVDFERVKFHVEYAILCVTNAYNLKHSSPTMYYLHLFNIGITFRSGATRRLKQKLLFHSRQRASSCYLWSLLIWKDFLASYHF